MIGIVEDIDLLQIRLSRRPLRMDIGHLGSLAESIEENGLLQPIVVRIINGDGHHDDDYHFEIVAGNRRFLACKQLRLRRVPCHIVDLQDKEAYEISLIENVQRRSMNPIEEGQAYSRYTADYGWGAVSELAKVIGKSQEYVSKRIKLLELPEEMQKEIIRRRIKPSTGEELAFIKDKETQSRLSKMVSERHLTVKQLRREIAITAAVGEELEVDKDGTHIEKICRRGMTAYDKAIVALKLSLRKINDTIESLEVEEDWLLNASLLQHRAIISSQIDSLLREKRKYSQLAYKRRPLLIY